MILAGEIVARLGGKTVPKSQQVINVTLVDTKGAAVKIAPLETGATNEQIIAKVNELITLLG